MEASFFSQAAKFLREKKQNKRWMIMFLCSAVLVVLVTVAALRMYGQAMTHQVKTLECSAEVHEHREECYDDEGNLICGYTDYLLHIHNDDCYDTNGELVCPLPETEPHEHTEECYQELETLVCGVEESAGHQHDMACYAMTKDALTCTLEEHTHGDDCYSQQQVLVCDVEESEEHAHTEECYALESGILNCGMEEHTHDDNCYAWTEGLVCTVQEGEGGHAHTEECYGIDLVPACDEPELHTHEEACFDQEGNLICGRVQLEEHIHGEGCFKIMELTNEEIEILNKNSQTSGGEKTFEGNGYVVTASYGANANIPEDAEFVARLITPDEDPGHYAQREEEFQETLGDEEVTMSALFHIGFYVDGEEIEPRSAVTVTVQFLDENGLADGEPITVVHFAEKGTEVLDGSDAEDNSTTFEMDSFSEIAIGRRGMGKMVEISESFAYADEEFHITFHIEGKARLAAENSPGTGTAEGAGQENTMSDAGSVSPEAGENGEEAGEAAGEAGEEPDAINPGTEAMEEESVPKAGVMADTGAASDAGVSPETGDRTKADVLAEGEEAAGSQIQEPEENAGTAQETDTNNQAPAAGVCQVPASGDSAFLLEVAQLDESSREFVAISECAQELETEEGSIPLALRGMTLSLTHEGQEIPLNNCQITAEIAPAESLIQQAEELSENEEEQNEIRVRVFTLQEDNQAAQLDNMLLSEENVQEETLDVALDSTTVGVSANGIANVHFKVQFFASIQVPDQAPASSDAELLLIDTSGNGDGTGGNLPRNGVATNTASLFLKAEGKTGSVIFKESLEEIYKEEGYDFSTYPELKNFNKFDNERNNEDEGQTRVSNYDVEEIWVLRDGSDEKSLEPGDWIIYDDMENLELTNSSQYEDDPNCIVIKEGTVLRLVGKPRQTTHNNSVAFYDFDITDGQVYSDYTDTYPNGWKIGDRNSTGVLHGYTNRQGINNKLNFEGQSGPRLGFGNANVNGTGLQEEMYNNSFINKNNSSNTGGCAFGIVSNTLGSNDYPVFNVAAPDLFSNKEQTGKTGVPGYSLDFDKSGDTYTLKAVNGSSVTGLDKFQLVFDKAVSWAPGGWKKIWSNQFWPMDSASTWGTDGHDLKFGDASKKDNRIAHGSKGGSEAFSVSDDEKDHNSYFSMNFSVGFELTEDYVGPLNYYFFGDDDMWVYLDDKLVCDIGGVHSSVGEYVDLWDYIKKGDSGKHTLRFFYNERGASGSTCWMQFTLPCAASQPVEEPVGGFKKTLTIRKAVTGEVVETDEAFEFAIELKDMAGNILKNDYDYMILGSDGTIDFSGTIRHGGTFYLKNGQTIEVKNLPDGASFSIREKEYGSYKPDISGSNIIESGTTAEGSIDWGRDDVVSYQNVVVGYALPETGGTGTKGIRIAALLQIVIAAALLGYRQVRRRKGGMGR